MNDTAQNIFKQIGIKENDLKVWKNLKEYDRICNVKVIEKGKPIFMRLDAKEEIEYIKNIMK